MLFNEPKLLKLLQQIDDGIKTLHFSALQRAEIAEIAHTASAPPSDGYFSALQRAEIAEIIIALGAP